MTKARFSWIAVSGLLLLHSLVSPTAAQEIGSLLSSERWR